MNSTEGTLVNECISTWQVESLEQGSDNRYFCDVCPKRKSVTGATPEGAKLAAVCHFSIQVLI